MQKANKQPKAKSTDELIQESAEKIRASQKRLKDYRAQKQNRCKGTDLSHICIKCADIPLI